MISFVSAHSFLSTSDTAFQSMRSMLISAYKFSKAGKVKQLRFGNGRGRRSERESIGVAIFASSTASNNFKHPDLVMGWGSQMFKRATVQSKS